MDSAVTHIFRAERPDGNVPVRVVHYPDGRVALSVADSVEAPLSPAQREKLRGLLDPWPGGPEARRAKATEHLDELEAAVKDLAGAAPDAAMRVRIAADDVRNDLLSALA